MQWRTSQMWSWPLRTSIPLYVCRGKEGRTLDVKQPSIQSRDSQAVAQIALRSPQTTIRKSKNDKSKVPRKPQLSAGDPTDCHSYPCSTKTIIRKAGQRFHLNYSVIWTSNSQGRQGKINAFTHQVICLELVS